LLDRFNADDVTPFIICRQVAAMRDPSRTAGVRPSPPRDLRRLPAPRLCSPVEASFFPILLQSADHSSGGVWQRFQPRTRCSPRPEQVWQAWTILSPM